MRVSRTVGFLSVLVLSCAPLAAQRTWIVDAANGPGTDFTWFFAAVAAARSGDTILVRRGVYYGYDSIDKGLTILGEPGATLPAIVVRNLPAGARLVMKGCTNSCAFPRVPVQLQLTGNRGSIHLEDLTVTPLSAPPHYRAAIEIRDCSSVTLNNCRVTLGGIDVARSTLAVSGGSCRGYDANCGYIGSSPGTPGLHATASEVVIDQVRLAGGDGCTASILAPAPAITADGSTLTVAGDTTTLAAGAFAGFAIPAAQGSNGSHLALDPKVVLTPSGGGPDHRGFASVTLRRMPSLSVAGTAPGGTSTVRLRSPQGHAFVIAAGLPIVPTAVPPFGTAWLDLRAFAVLAAGIQGNSELFQTSVRVPASPAIRGAAVAVQALSGAAASPGFSNPVVSIVH